MESNEPTCEKLQVHDITTITKAKLDMEGLSVSFKVKSHNYKGDYFSSTSSNAILFEFPTLKSQFPNLYNSPSYKMLLSFAFHQRQSFEPLLLNEIAKVKKKDNIDKIVLWSILKHDDNTTQFLKNCAIDIVDCAIPSTQEILNKPLHYFVPVEGKSLEYSLRANHVAEHLVTRLKKFFHLILSEIAAPIYDEYYAKDKVATQAIMKYEEAQLRKLLDRSKNENKTGIAVDVGCGTGRHTFVLSELFSQIYAFDLSPLMIQKAEEKKKSRGDTKVIFSVTDFEHEHLLDESKFHGKCDLVVASFGMGSFVEDTVKMLRRFYDWLKPGGYIFISFFNGNSITSKLTPNWRDTSLSSNIDLNTNSLKVELPSGLSLRIFCKPYSDSVKDIVSKMFNVDNIYMYPTIMALLPNSLLQDKFAADFFRHIDELLSDNHNLQKLTHFGQHLKNVYGHYVIMVAHKPDISDDGYKNIVERLKNEISDKYEILEHAPVLSIEDVKRLVGKGMNPSCMIKTIIFKNKINDDYISVSISSEKMVDKNRIAELLSTSKKNIKFASEKEVLEIGFPVGGIAPFGFKDDYTIHKFIDVEIKELKSDWLFMGVGDNRKTLKIRREVFIHLTKTHIWTSL